jgi:D-lactate dehydrogenase
MKILAYAARADERAAFDRYSAELGIDLTLVPEGLTAETVAKARGFEAVSILGNCRADAANLKALAEGGTRFLASRSAGYNNIDLAAAERYGIRVSNAAYSPNCVADFAVMLMLMSIRKAKTILNRSDAQDYSLAGVEGREMHNLTIGIIGTGRIGATTARNLSGFGSTILGYDMYPNADLKSVLTYVDFDELLARSDILSLHAPLTPESHHLINAKTLAKAKDGVIIVNCARGELIKTADLIDAIESKKVSAAALDVIENEIGIFHNDRRLDILTHRELAILRAFPNVIVTTHSAFYTDQAVSDMVEVGLRSLAGFLTTGQSPWEIKAEIKACA